MTSAVGGSPLPESLPGPCRRLRYHELNTHKVTSQSHKGTRRHSSQQVAGLADAADRSTSSLCGDGT
jgi:hypothetical protein